MVLIPLLLTVDGGSRATPWRRSPSDQKIVLKEYVAECSASGLASLSRDRAKIRELYEPN